MELTPDKVVDASIEMLNTRSLFGIKKYGVTLDNNPAPRPERIQHALEEAADLLNYLMWEKMRLADDGNPDNLVLKMATMLHRCALQFEFYTDQHMAKSPPDTEKAATNRKFAEMCRATASLAPSSGPDVEMTEALKAISQLCAKTYIGHERAFTALSLIQGLALKALA